MTQFYRRYRMPFLKKPITHWMLDEVRNRHQNALIEAGGEPVLLYMPNGQNNTAVWDDVRQTYLKSDRKYELYLNRDRDRFGKRLYTENTRLVPSCLVAFPLNPDKEQLREDGFLLSNNSNAWTLWAPIVVPKESFIVRDNTATGEREYWVVDAVLYSTFPNAPRDLNKLLHQEFQLTRMTPESMHFDPEQVLSVDETLSRKYWALTSSTSGLTLNNGSMIIDQQALKITDNTTITTNYVWSTGACSFELKNSSFVGDLSFRIGQGAVNNEYIEILLTLDATNQTLQLGIKFDGVDYPSDEITLVNNRFRLIKFYIQEPYIEIDVDGELIHRHSLLPIADYTAAKPFNPTNMKILTEGVGSVYMKSLRIMDLI